MKKGPRRLFEGIRRWTNKISFQAIRTAANRTLVEGAGVNSLKTNFLNRYSYIILNNLLKDFV